MNLFRRGWNAVQRTRPSAQALRPTQALDIAAAELRSAHATYAGVGVVLIDGRSGSGKTEFAQHLHHRCLDTQILHLDDLYPDWDGLATGVERAKALVHAWSARENATYLPTQWPGTPARQPVTLDPDRSLLVEGVGARTCLPHPSNDTLTLTIYLNASTETRRHRALERDGVTYAPHWDTWAAQEDAFLREYPVDSTDPDLLFCCEDGHA